MAFRSKGLPVPENILAKFDQWAGRLQALQHQAISNTLPRDEGELILQALELAGDRKNYRSLKRLADLQRRRRIATDIARLHERGVTWRQIASRMGLSIQAAKDVFYEFAPGTMRKNKGAAVGEGLAEAHRRMIAK